MRITIAVAAQWDPTENVRFRRPFMVYRAHSYSAETGVRVERNRCLQGVTEQSNESIWVGICDYESVSRFDFNRDNNPKY